MIKGVDSSTYRPTGEAVQSARAADVHVWSGYLSTRDKDEVRLLSPWDRGSFDVARQCGGTPLAYCSGWDDPKKCKEMAADWNVRLCLDVEDGIRGNGDWVQGWLDESGAGLYGNYWVFEGRRAPFYVLTAFPGSDPGDTWGTAYCPRPAGPCGWQWRGSHDEFGGAIDSCWFDDWFGRDGTSVERRAVGGGEGSMILLSAPDGRSHRLMVEDRGQKDAAGIRGGPVRWIAVPGGAGGLWGWGGGDGELGGDGGWIAAGTLAAELWFWSDRNRETLIVQGRGLDGATWQKVVFTDDYSTHQAWHPVKSPSICVPGS
jgi:hypothetical protein